MRLSVGIDGKLECPECGKITTLKEKDVISKKDYYIFHIICKNCLNIFTISIRNSPSGGVLVDFYKVRKSINIDYKSYILSEEWKAKANDAKERSGYRCQLCNGDGTLHTHHRTYDNLGDELPEDLIVLCSDCHAKFHDKALV